MHQSELNSQSTNNLFFNMHIKKNMSLDNFQVPFNPFTFQNLRKVNDFKKCGP